MSLFSRDAKQVEALDLIRGLENGLAKDRGGRDAILQFLSKSCDVPVVVIDSWLAAERSLPPNTVKLIIMRLKDARVSDFPLVRAVDKPAVSAPVSTVKSPTPPPRPNVKKRLVALSDQQLREIQQRLKQKGFVK